MCGGRCLYANATKLWGDRGFEEVCGTVSNLIETLRETAAPQIKQLLASGKIQLEQFDYPTYNGCEIIP
jgi:hypothetical protein